MVLDSLDNFQKYITLNHRFNEVFQFFKTNDLSALPIGKIKLDGDDIIVNIVDADGKTVDEARMETHDNYLDIQIPLEAKETMGWKPFLQLNTVTELYNPDKDVTFYADKATTLIEVIPSQFVIFFPEDGHQPGIFEGCFRKIIIKVKV